ncbi:MAG: hypothetical protein K0R03_2065 [Moraxellaceae bacterium]|nr:hypothetical protein [Moraxellaceae bacterium]MDF3031507.1 hypothetical protein [Moraxellaceae bacterium]
MMRATLSTCALLLAVSSGVHAAPLPSAGMSMQAVEKQFGQPLKKNAAIGQPPITRWEYDGYVVVFERSTVVGSVNVVRAAGASQPVPAPAAAAKAPARAPAPAAAAPVPTVATPVTAPAPEPAPAAAPAPATAAAPAPAPSAPATAPAGDDAMSKAAAEKAAQDKAPASDVPPPAESYTFDPETGRIIIK